jgi:hypothetical protein
MIRLHISGHFVAPVRHGVTQPQNPDVRYTVRHDLSVPAHFVQDSQEEMVDDKERFIRQVETRRELHRSITREEKRKEEVLKVFEGLGELAKRRVEVPHSPPWEPCRW